jgi:hypothetical protein
MKGYQTMWPDRDFSWPESVEKKEVDLYGTSHKTELIFKKN